MWRKLKKVLNNFFSGAFDYDQPTAGGGCCGCVEVDPNVRREYRETRSKMKRLPESK